MMRLGLHSDGKMGYREVCCREFEIYNHTSCTRPRVAVAHSGATEENEERGIPRFKYV
jgi:hypothetical protein